MRRLIIDVIARQTAEMKRTGDTTGFNRNIELLRDIVCSIAATIRPGEPWNDMKHAEIKVISDYIEQLTRETFRKVKI